MRQIVAAPCGKLRPGGPSVATVGAEGSIALVSLQLGTQAPFALLPGHPPGVRQSATGQLGAFEFAAVLESAAYRSLRMR